jgi:hypothetical protein
MNLVAFLLARLKEPSTYSGLAALLMAAGVHFSDAQLNAAIAAAVAIAGLVAVFVPEAKLAPVAAARSAGDAPPLP